MVESYCLGSSSSGNAYIFRMSDPKDEWHHQILVEAGFPYQELVKRAIMQGTKLSECEAALITHCHSDHSCGAYRVNDAGIKVFSSRETLEDKNVGIIPNQSNVLKDWSPTYICPNVEVLPFLVEHDAPSPMGFVIRNVPSSENILFINDCKTVRHDLSGIPIDYCFIECNYSDQPMHIEYSNAKRDGNIPLIKRYARIFRVHMGLYATRNLLKTLDLHRCKGIFLMHLSDRNARENEMRQKIGEDHPDVKVYVCGKYGGIC